MTTRDAILARLRLAERDEESIPLGETVRLRELTRSQFRDAVAFAAIDDALRLERLRGSQLAANVREADGDLEAIAAALYIYDLGPPSSASDTDRWYAAILAASAVDVETNQPLFERSEILAWPNRDDLWDEVRRLALLALEVSHTTVDSLKNESAPSSPATE